MIRPMQPLMHDVDLITQLLVRVGGVDALLKWHMQNIGHPVAWSMFRLHFIGVGIVPGAPCCIVEQ